MGADAKALIDLDSVRHNFDALKTATTSTIMAVVKSDAYGHGAVEVARAVTQRGAKWLAVGLPAEALAIRAAGITVPVLLLRSPASSELPRMITSCVDVAVGDLTGLADVVRAARAAGKPARVHLEVDTGISRGGFVSDGWEDALTSTARCVAEGSIELIAIWTHFSHSDAGDEKQTEAQLRAFQDALSAARRHGLDPLIRHAANSTAMLADPETHFDLVRPGSAIYGLLVDGTLPQWAPFVPAMTVKAPVVELRAAGFGLVHAQIPIGALHGVSPAAVGMWATTQDGVHAYLTKPVGLEFSSWRIPKSAVGLGEELLLLGPGGSGEPTAYDWSRRLSTIANEIINNFGHSLPKQYLGRPSAAPAADAGAGDRRRPVKIPG